MKCTTPTALREGHSCVWSRGGRWHHSRRLHSPPAGGTQFPAAAGRGPPPRRVRSGRGSAVPFPTCRRRRPGSTAGPACPSASGPRVGPGALLTSPSLGAGPAGQARSLCAVCSYPRGRGLGAPGGTTRPARSARPRAKGSALRLRGPRAPLTPQLPKAGHTHCRCQQSAPASQLNLVSPPSSAPAAHPALLQAPADQNGIQRGLCCPGRRPHPCPRCFDPCEGWTPGPPLFAPSCSLAPIVGQIHPEFPQSREPGPSAVSLHPRGRPSRPPGPTNPLPSSAAALDPGPSSGALRPPRPARAGVGEAAAGREGMRSSSPSESAGGGEAAGGGSAL